MTQAKRYAGRHDVDMTSGPLFLNVLKFVFPLLVTNILQQFYHAADMMIVGMSGEPDAVGAVGSTASFLVLIRNLFIGFSVGVSVVVARHIGEKDRDKTSKAMHTSVCMSLLFGALGAIVGILLARPVLVGMGYTDTLLTLGIRYAYIYLACLPFLALTNFLGAILQAQGDTKSSLYVLTATGILNILLNLFFVKVVGLSVEGVAIATAIANLVSALALWYRLSQKEEGLRLFVRQLKIDRAQFADVAKIGFPAGIQNTFFSISNILIQSSMLRVNHLLSPANSAYAPVIKGNAAAGSIEDFIFVAMAAVVAAASAFTAQNVGAKQYRRIRRVFFYICLVGVALTVLMPLFLFLLRTPLLSLYGVKRGDVLGNLAYDTAVKRMLWKWGGFFIYAVMVVCTGVIRGLGKSSLSAAVTFFGTCIFRIVWIYTVFEFFESLESIYISYPISWLLTGAFFLVLFERILRRRIRENEPDGQNATSPEAAESIAVRQS